MRMQKLEESRRGESAAGSKLIDERVTPGSVRAEAFSRLPGRARRASSRWVRLERDPVVRRQAAQPVGQAAAKPPAAPAHDDHVEELRLLRQVALNLHGERRAGEEVGQQQAEEAAVPRQLFARILGRIARLSPACASGRGWPRPTGGSERRRRASPVRLVGRLRRLSEGEESWAVGSNLDGAGASGPFWGRSLQPLLLGGKLRSGFKTVSGEPPVLSRRG
jgi:hypothetical protein